MSYDYTIKDKEKEFLNFLYFGLCEFEEAIRYNDTTELKQDTCDIMRLIMKSKAEGGR